MYINNILSVFWSRFGAWAQRVSLAEKEIPNCMKNLHGGGGIQIVEHIY